MYILLVVVAGDDVRRGADAQEELAQHRAQFRLQITQNDVTQQRVVLARMRHELSTNTSDQSASTAGKMYIHLHSRATYMYMYVYNVCDTVDVHTINTQT